MSSPRPRRHGAGLLLRGYGAATVAVVPAAVSHGIAADEAIPALAIVVSIVLAAVVCVPLVGRRVSRARVAAAVAASQGVLHSIFAVADGARPAVDVVAPVPSAHVHSVDAAAALLAADAGPGADAALSASAHLAHALAPGMLAGHALAAVATTLLAWYGMSLARGLVSLSQRAVESIVRVLDLVVRAPGRTAVAVRGTVRRLRARGALRLAAPRGPPVLASAIAS